jgi:hypothetical protein
MYIVRKETNRVLEMAEDGVISWEDIARIALNWMSEDDVAEMLRANDLIFDDEDYEEDEDDRSEMSWDFGKHFD